MKGIHSGEYPANWKDIARRVKEAAGWKCERCGAAHGPSPYVLTVHHLDMDPANCELWNLAALCQRCHLSKQGRLNMFQDYMFDELHAEWFRSHLEGRDAAVREGKWP